MSAHVMSECAYLNGSVFLVKTRDFLHENCAKCRKLCVVFKKKCVLELQFESKARIVFVVQQNWYRGLVSYMLWSLCVSSTSICV